MNDAEKEARLLRFWDGDLPAEEREAVERLIFSDPEARAFLDDLDRLKAGLEELPDILLTRRPRLPGAPGSRGQVWRRLAAVAALLALLAGGAHLLREPAGGGNRADPARPGETLAAAPDTGGPAGTPWRFLSGSRDTHARMRSARKAVFRVKRTERNLTMKG